MTLTCERIGQMSGGDFKRTFAHSAISRLRYKTLRRNAAMIEKKNFTSNK
jgi:epoxyqueuosine reductase QueG